VSVNNTVNGSPGTVLTIDYILTPPNVTDLNGFLQALSALSSVNIPLPKLESFSFASATMSNEEAKRLLPESSTGELFLQLPMQPSFVELRARVEENSKWTSGRVAASGSTAGPQTPQ